MHEYMQDEKEISKLSNVTQIILDKINILGAGLEGKRKEVLEVRKEMWREARIVLRDFDDVADLTIFAEDVARHENQYAATAKELTKLSKMLDSPYFARIDFIEEGFEDEPEEIYIGRHSLFDEKANAYHVYDWRAPISSLYYDHGVGQASFAVPGTGAVINGQLVLKRQYQIEKGKMLYLFDNDMAIDDEILRMELSKASDAHIKTIINTIQADQNRAIRAEASHVLVLGAAGSGKTSVGLHRLAYLLYRERANLTSAKVRIFSPSPIFASYIEGIIPALGEDDVMNLDFPALLAGHRLLFHGLYHQIEHLFAESGENNPHCTWVHEKYSPQFLDALEELVASNSPSFEDVYFYKDKICEANRLKDLYQDRTTSSTLASKTSRILGLVNQAYVEYFKNNRRSISQLFDSIHDDTFNDGEIQSKFDEEKNIVLADLKNRLQPSARRLYERHLRAWARREKLDSKFARDALRMEKLYYEDALILFYIDILAGKVPQDKSVKHILLDEAQDLSHLQHRILRKLYTASHFTVLADTNQALYPEINITDPDVLKSLYPQAEVFALTKSYRSTYEINRFAAGLLKDSTIDGSFARHGEEPVIVSASDPTRACMDILAEFPENFNTVGILLTTAKDAAAFYDKLRKVYPKGNTPRPLQLISGESQDFKPGVMVMAVSLAKGLEFDAVICPGYGSPVFDGARGQKLLYLICTRALHRLYLLQ